MKLQTLKPKVQALKTSTLQTVDPSSWRSTKTSSTARGYGYKWQQARAAFLAEHPLCECQDCQAGVKRTTPSTVVDHKTPHRGDQRLFWDRSNWQAMSKPCHDRKTQQETAAGL